MRHSSYFCAAVLSAACSVPVYASNASDDLEPSNSETQSKTQLLAQSAIAKSSEVAKKLSVNANAAQADETKDPFESFNRKMYAFNDVLDRNIARPLAIQYVEKVPDDVRGSYRQFRRNLNEPWNAVNQLVQGRPGRAAKTFGRFTINTLTTLGFADPARRLNLLPESEGLGITLGYYGVPTGPYLVLPVFGPSTIREGIGLAVDNQARPQKYLMDDAEGLYWSDQLMRGIDARSQLLDLEKTLQGDKYAQIRDFYLQRINFAVSEKKGTADENMFISDDDFDDTSDSESNDEHSPNISQTDTDTDNAK